MLLNRFRANDYMRLCNLDGLVATSSVNITYFTDYYCWMDGLFKEYMLKPGTSSRLALQGYAILPLDGTPTLIVNALFAVHAAELAVHEVCVFGDPILDKELRPVSLPPDLQRVYDLLHETPCYPTPEQALRTVIKSRGLTGARLGVEMGGLSNDTKETLVSSLQSERILDCTNLIRMIRAVKSPAEIDRLRKAAELNQQAAMESLALAKTGRPLADLAHHYRARISELGADCDHYVYGLRGLGLAMNSEYSLADEDVMCFDYGCVYRRYFSDSGTTLSLRRPPDAVVNRLTALKACIAAGKETIKPGVKASAVSTAMREALNGRGVRASFPHGHGLGLEIRDYPVIVADNGLRIRDDCLNIASDLPLEANMVINLESMINMLGVGSLEVEESFLVTSGGCELLVQ